MSKPSAGLSILLAKLTRDEMNMLVAEVDAAHEAGIAEGRRLERGDVLARLDARPHIPGMPLVLFEDEIRKIVRGEHVATKEAK